MYAIYRTLQMCHMQEDIFYIIKSYYTARHKIFRKNIYKFHISDFITSGLGIDLVRIAGALFSRWSQENFFKYAEREFDPGD